MKNDISSLLNKMKDRFTGYKTYYQILGINPSEATDEKVKELYEKKCNQLEEFFKKCPVNQNTEIKQQISEVKELIQTTFDDAFSALKSKNSRKNYDELLEKIQKTNKKPNNKIENRVDLKEKSIYTYGEKEVEL